VTGVAGLGSFGYDQNGNMLTRTVGSTIYAQTFNAENKLASVTWPGHSVSFTYDGDGERLLKTEDGVTTVYLGNYYEKTGSAVTKYCLFGDERACPECNRRVAMRDSSGVKYFHSDQLGSANVTTDSNGAVYQIRHHPYGSERWSSGLDATDYDFILIRGTGRATPRRLRAARLPRTFL